MQEVKLITKVKYFDVEENHYRFEGDIFTVAKERAIKLLDLGLVDILEIKLSEEDNAKTSSDIKRA